MIRILIVIIILFYTNTVSAQLEGIKFMKDLSWSQIKQKAKQENKYIFLDAYTTWCLPCRVMTNEIFPQPAVGNFFNTNFINVAVQFDITKKDKEEIRAWYKDAKLLKSSYKIDSYPTYLFFNPQGDLIHSVIGASEKAEDFLSKSKLALDPSTQYNVLKGQFEGGNRSEGFLKGLFAAAQLARDQKFLPTVGNAYLTTQNDLLLKENLIIIEAATTKSSDPGFAVLRDYPEKFDAIVGIGKSSAKMKYIAYNELVFPQLRKDPTITEYGGGMVIYGGTVRDSVDWSGIKKNLDSTYPNLAAEILLSGKIAYFESAKNWQDYVKSVEAYIPIYNGDINNWLNSHANTIFRQSEDRALLDIALAWSKKTVAVEDMQYKMYFSNAYGNLLYKIGKKEEAISVFEEIRTYTKDKDGSYAALINKMKNGEKTW